MPASTASSSNDGPGFDGVCQNEPLRSFGQRRVKPGRAGASCPLRVHLLLPGCTHVHTAAIDRHVIVGSVPEDYRTNHPIAIEEGIETLDVPAGLNTVSLTTGVKEIIDGFAQAFLAAAPARLPSSRRRLDQPGGGPCPRGRDTAVLVDAGVNPNQRLSSASTGPSRPRSPHRSGWPTARSAHTAACGPWPDQVTPQYRESQLPNYGCATQQISRRWSSTRSIFSIRAA